LQHKGLLSGDFACAPEILHMVAVDACTSADAANLIGAAKAVMPKSNRDQAGRSTYYYHLTPLPQDIDLFRHLRLAVYAGDEAGFRRLGELVEAEETEASGHPIFTRFLARFPLSQTWLAQLPAAIREMFAEHTIRMSVEYGGEQSVETLAIFQQYADAAPGKAGTALNKLLLRSDILSANFA